MNTRPTGIYIAQNIKKEEKLKRNGRNVFHYLMKNFCEKALNEIATSKTDQTHRGT